MRALLGAGKPRAAYERLVAGILTIFEALRVSWGDSEVNRWNTDRGQFARRSPVGRHLHSWHPRKRVA